MSSNTERNTPFDTNADGIDLSGSSEIQVPALSTQDWGHVGAMSDTIMMRGLQQASDDVLRLATATYSASASGDASRVQAARASLEKKLAMTTTLIDALLSRDSASH
ncbi:hypothetical protein [Paraburkholderia sp.]|uniref:hypothetical protein n=1 Tax=Paraburkholderia sp. TaxID=1926495 RepID=UPI00239E1CE7|nr:hypothetical protein [Paraburkholderia sp.]MDE1181844.1 hypothetical protein [Paraburkholderia sp.]